MPRSIPVIISMVLVALCFAMPCRPLMGQDKGVPIEPYRVSKSDKLIITKAKSLKEAGKLLSRKEVLVALRSPQPETLRLPKASAKPLKPRALAVLGRKSQVRIGWFYLCQNCTHWHLNIGGGYAITADGVVATCYHCLVAKDIAMREGYLIAINSDNDVLPVTAVLARDTVMDVGIVRVAGKPLTPLALNDKVAPGDSVYLYSNPMRVAGYFSAGMINRFFWRRGARPGNPTNLRGARNLRMHVSTDWAPGSSGAPVLDSFGNAVGHVAVISSLQKSTRRPSMKSSTKPTTKTVSNDDQKHKSPVPITSTTTMMVLHEAIPARAVKLLAESLVSKAKKNSSKTPAAR